MLKGREDGEKTLWLGGLLHPIADGPKEKIIIPQEERPVHLAFVPADL